MIRILLTILTIISLSTPVMAGSVDGNILWCPDKSSTSMRNHTGYSFQNNQVVIFSIEGYEIKTTAYPYIERGPSEILIGRISIDRGTLKINNVTQCYLVDSTQVIEQHLQETIEAVKAQNKI